MDDTWVHHFQPETKQQSKHWTLLGSLPHNNAKTGMSTGKVMASIFWRCSSVVRAFAHGAMGRRIDPLSYFSLQPVHYDWCNKGRGMYYPVCGMMHIKEPLLLIGSGFLLSLSEWSFTMSDAI